MSSDRPSLQDTFKPRSSPRPASPARPAAITVVPDEPTEPVLDEPIGNVAAYLPTALRGKVLDTVRARGVTLTELLFEALDAVLDPAATGAVDLFPTEGRGRSGMPMTRRRKSGGEGTIQIQLRLSSSQKRWLDEQALANGADNRSAFVAAVFRQYLNA